MPILGVEAREHDKPREVIPDQPEHRVYLLVDGLLNRAGVTDVRYMRVGINGEIQPPGDEARSALGDFVAIVDDSSDYLKDGIEEESGRSRRFSPELHETPLHYRRTRWHRYAEHAVRLLANTGREIQASHELYPGRGKGVKIQTTNDTRLRDTARMIAGVERKISNGLEKIPDKRKRSRVAAGLLGIAVGEAGRELRGSRNSLHRR